MIEGYGLSLSRGHNLIINALDVTVDQGSALIVRGPNGSGKTTLLRAMAGLLPPQRGMISLNGFSLDEDRINALASMIYIGHRDGFSGHLTPLENLFLWATGRGHDAAITKAAIPDALSRLGIEDLIDTPLYTMSEGQRKRCGLARLSLSLSLALNPALSFNHKKSDHSAMKAPCWILDEPLTALDDDTIKDVTTLLDEHTRQGGAVLLSSHHDIALPSATIMHLSEDGDAS